MAAVLNTTTMKQGELSATRRRNGPSDRRPYGGKADDGGPLS